MSLWIWQQYNFIWCSPALLHLRSSCTCLLLHLYFISTDKFSEASMTAAAGVITEVGFCGQSFKVWLSRLFLFLLLILSKIKKINKLSAAAESHLDLSGLLSKYEIKSQDNQASDLPHCPRFLWTQGNGLHGLVVLCPPSHRDTQYCWTQSSKVSSGRQPMTYVLIYGLFFD